MLYMKVEVEAQGMHPKLKTNNFIRL